MDRQSFKIFYRLVLILLAISPFVIAQRYEFKPNYDENKIPGFDLPDPLKTFAGKKIRNSEKWMKIGRPELLQFFTANVYGRVPEELNVSSIHVMEESEDAYHGKAIRKQVRLSFRQNEKNLDFTILMYLPKSLQEPPIFLGYNFYGNHTVTEDINVIISDAWVRNNPSLGIINNQLTEQSRGVRTSRWAIEKILNAGFGLATIYYGEIDPDKNDFTDGVHPFFYEDDQQQPAPDEWGSIAAWAWGLSQAKDYFEQDKDVNKSKVIVFGHSRLGKTSLWAGVTDRRFAAVISNNSGCGGATLSKRKIGETVGKINNVFPHWFCDNFNNYSNNEEALPVDQHELLALIAPRPVYVASAEDDKWSDQKGEFLSAYYATPVYELFGKKGIPSKKMPEVNQPIQNTVAYHIRTGKHDVTAFDWDQYINWVKEQILTNSNF